MKDHEFKALILSTKIKLRRLKKKLKEADGSGNYYARWDIKVCIDAIHYELFNISSREHNKKTELAYDYD